MVGGTLAMTAKPPCGNCGKAWDGSTCEMCADLICGAPLCLHRCCVDGCRRCGAEMPDNAAGPWCQLCLAEASQTVAAPICLGNMIPMDSETWDADKTGPRRVLREVEAELAGAQAQLRRVISVLDTEPEWELAAELMGWEIRASTDGNYLYVAGLSPVAARRVVEECSMFNAVPLGNAREWTAARARLAETDRKRGA